MIWSVSASGNFKGSLVVSMSKARTTGSWVRANTLRHFKADLKVKVILIRLARPSGGAASKPEPPPGNHFTDLSTQSNTTTQAHGQNLLHQCCGGNTRCILEITAASQLLRGKQATSRARLQPAWQMLTGRSTRSSRRVISGGRVLPRYRTLYQWA